MPAPTTARSTKNNMKIGLASYRCENKDVQFNIRQIERAMKEAQGKADLLCFGEAFLQGFDSLCWDYEKDRTMAAEQSSEPIRVLRGLTEKYGTALLTGYIEREQDRLYSSCIVLRDGGIVHNYRRISRGWKEYTRTDSHYCEGNDTAPFELCGKKIMLSLCGDLWDYPERFKTDHLLIWPVYVNYSREEWESGALTEYAGQALLASGDTLMVNPIDRNPVNHGGSFRFQSGAVTERIPFDEEKILITDIP